MKLEAMLVPLHIRQGHCYALCLSALSAWIDVPELTALKAALIIVKSVLDTLTSAFIIFYLPSLACCTGAAGSCGPVRHGMHGD